MSEKTFVTCDGPNCTQESKDYMADGWIVLEGGLTRYTGRSSHGQAECDVYLDRKTEPRHFCSQDCLLKPNNKRPNKR